MYERNFSYIFGNIYMPMFPYPCHMYEKIFPYIRVFPPLALSIICRFYRIPFTTHMKTNITHPVQWLFMVKTSTVVSYVLFWLQVWQITNKLTWMVHFICIYVIIVIRVSKRNSLNSLTGLRWKNSNRCVREYSRCFSAYAYHVHSACLCGFLRPTDSRCNRIQCLPFSIKINSKCRRIVIPKGKMSMATNRMCSFLILALVLIINCFILCSFAHCCWKWIMVSQSSNSVVIIVVSDTVEKHWFNFSFFFWNFIKMIKIVAEK